MPIYLPIITNSLIIVIICYFFFDMIPHADSITRHRAECGKHGNDNQGNDQPVFHGSRAALILQKVLEKKSGRHVKSSLRF